MTGETLSIRLDPVPESVVLSRVFVGGVLGVLGVPDQDVEDVRVAVSDVASGLVEAGLDIEIAARVGDGKARLEGNCVDPVPQAGPLLLGDRMTFGGQRWAINIQGT